MTELTLAEHDKWSWGCYIGIVLLVLAVQGHLTCSANDVEGKVDVILADTWLLRKRAAKVEAEIASLKELILAADEKEKR